MRIFGIIAVLLLIVAQAHPVHADTFTSDPCGQGALNIPTPPTMVPATSSGVSDLFAGRYRIGTIDAGTPSPSL